MDLQGWHGEPATSRQPVARRACSPAAWGRRLLIHGRESCHMHHQADHHHHLLPMSPLLSPITIASSRPDPAQPNVQIPARLWGHLRSIAGSAEQDGSWEMKGRRPGCWCADDSHHLQHLVYLYLSIYLPLSTPKKFSTQMSGRLTHSTVSYCTASPPPADHQQQERKKICQKLCPHTQSPPTDLTASAPVVPFVALRVEAAHQLAKGPPYGEAQDVGFPPGQCSPGSFDPRSHLNRARGHVQIPHHWPPARVLADVTGCDATPAHAYKLQTTTDVLLGRTIIYCLRPRSPLPACVFSRGICRDNDSAVSVSFIN